MIISNRILHILPNNHLLTIIAAHTRSPLAPCPPCGHIRLRIRIPIKHNLIILDLRPQLRIILTAGTAANILHAEGIARLAVSSGPRFRSFSRGAVVRRRTYDEGSEDGDIGCDYRVGEFDLFAHDELRGAEIWVGGVDGGGDVVEMRGYGCYDGEAEREGEDHGGFFGDGELEGPD